MIGVTKPTSVIQFVMNFERPQPHMFLVDGSSNKYGTGNRLVGVYCVCGSDRRQCRSLNTDAGVTNDDYDLVQLAAFLVHFPLLTVQCQAR